MKRRAVTSGILFLSIAASTLAAQPLMENDPLLGDPRVPVLYPLATDQQPTEIQAPDWVDDLYAEKLAVEQTDGTGPTTGYNGIYITIPWTPDWAGSECEYIYMDFGPNHSMQLHGLDSGTPFPPGHALSWDFSSHSGWLQSVSQEAWDYITLRSVCTDGLKISRVIVTHSSEEIINWVVDDWLDSPDHSHMGLAAKILERKLGYFPNNTQAAVNYGLRELGKTDGDKYGTSGAWCSEFASWCLRRDGWDTPTGSIDTGDMRTFFANQGRLYNQMQILSAAYLPSEGDYLSLFNGGHSAIFVEWVGGTPSWVTPLTQFRTIEGNAGSAVRRRVRTVGDIDHVGKAK